ncbi:hypothetical protein [Pseudoroseomonas cervicalis]|uniref:hypothetical protein n=1 Tax=Teichococcus cervicalis TaxID=204525 RepID=UPI0022F172F8|nr:hypothetical protein [Pseudoroseomonas cervicalis]WBV43335.1 hypothetical protein PFY06_01810 [Pseudoroseomonas cervicalis]
MPAQGEGAPGAAQRVHRQRRGARRLGLHGDEGAGALAGGVGDAGERRLGQRQRGGAAGGEIGGGGGEEAGWRMRRPCGGSRQGGLGGGEEGTDGRGRGRRGGMLRQRGGRARRRGARLGGG